MSYKRSLSHNEFRYREKSSHSNEVLHTWKIKKDKRKEKSVKNKRNANKVKKEQ